MTSARLDPIDGDAVSRFILENTQALRPPLVPEIALRLAAESIPIWQKTEEELGEMNLPPPFWAFAWAGGQAVARYLLDHPDICRGQNVLDLGAGSGIAGIAAALTPARRVRVADIDPFAQAACAINAIANGVTVVVEVLDVLEAAPGDEPVVLIGDLFYERQLAERVLAYIEAAKARGAVVLIGDPGRSYFPAEQFTKLCEYAVPVTRELEDAEIKKSAVWQA